MRVMVTGGTGFIGSHAVVALVRAGHQVRLLVRDADKAKRVYEPHGVEVDDFVVGDMTDPSAVAEALDGCVACLHTAAIVAVSTTGGDLSKNTTGARVVLGSAVRAGCDPVVYTSSVAVFVPPVAPVISVRSPLADPRSAYGKSKLEAEHYTRGLEDAGAPITVFYPGGVTGPHQPVLDSNVEGLVDVLRIGLPVCSTGGNAVIDVRDLAQLIVAAMVPGQGPRRFMAGGRFHSWSAYGTAIAEAAGRPIRRWPTPPALLNGMGSALDALRRVRPIDFAINRESTTFMTAMTATDDQPTLDALGVTYRPTVETLRDTIDWLVDAGHLDPALAPGRGSRR